MAYYAALISVVQILDEIIQRDQYKKFLLNKKQIASVHKRLSLLQASLEDYSPKDREAADILESRIRDAAYRAEDIIETQISRKGIYTSKVPRPLLELEKVKKEVDSIVEELIRIKVVELESHTADHEDQDLPLKNFYVSANGALVPLLQLLEKMIFHHDPLYLNSLHKGQIASLYEKFKLLKDLLDKEESADDRLEKGIRDAAHRTQDIIETHISSQKRGNLTLSILAKEYQDLEKVKEEVDSIIVALKVESLTTHQDYSANSGGGSSQIEAIPIGMESHTIHEDNLKGVGYSENSAGASTQAPRIDSAGGASKEQLPSGRITMVGFDEHFKIITEKLLGQSLKREVISIVGMGGIGKTTLARNTFGAKLIYERFECRVWVTVSQDYHLRDLLLAILKSLNIPHEFKEQDNKLKENVYKHLIGRRYLIIMDDVWNTKFWDDLKRIFPNDSNGSRIMITTRQSDVAFYASNPNFIQQIPFLSESQSWNLFCQKAVCPPYLEDIGRLIARNCRGLPLAIVVVAGLLSKTNKRLDWEKIARDITSIAANNDEHFSKILSLSYNHLPHHLKPCFLYFGGFPEDYEIRVSKLIRLWVAEGFLKPIRSKSLEEVGEKYLEELVNRNLVLVTKWGSSGKFKICSIHDLLRDLCSKRACHEKFLLVPKIGDVREDAPWNARRIYLHRSLDFTPRELKGKKYVSLVRSILFVRAPTGHEDFRIMDKSPRLMDERNILRVLYSPSMQIEWFHEEISKMLHLRYLAFSGWSFDICSSIYKLKNLQTLIVHKGSNTSGLFDIWKMPNLRHVKIDGMELPSISYGGHLLERLETLEEVENFTFSREVVEMIPNLKRLKVFYNEENVWEKSGLNDLVHLHQLERLQICIYNRNASPLPKNFAFPSTLIKLTLNLCQLPWKDMKALGLLPNLQVLKLQLNAFVGEKWDLEAIPFEDKPFPSLKFLQMESLYSLKYWLAEDTPFPCLEHLRIINCQELEEIPSEIGDISTLQLIEVRDCSSDLESSTMKILEEQRDMGNDVLQVHILKYEIYV